MADEQPSVRESLSASIDALSGAGGSEPGGGAAPAAPGADSAAGGGTAAGGSLYEPAPTPAPAADDAPKARSGELPPPDPAAPRLGSQQQAPAQTPAAPAQSGLRPPSAWNPEVREKWGVLPPEVQQEVLRRERVIAKSLQESAEARRGVAEFQRISAPYQQLIAMEGGNPLAAFGDYLKTMAVLRIGSPIEKAQAVAQAVTMFGIDIRTLDNVLAHALGTNGLPQVQAAQQPRQAQAQEFRDPRVDQFIQERSQAMEQAARAEVEDFYNDAQYEFLDDVRHDMADMLELASKNNRPLSLNDAYYRACMMNPQIGQIMSQRQLATTANRQNGQFAAKQRAAGSVTPTAGASSSPTNGKALSVREAIEQSISQLAG